MADGAENLTDRGQEALWAHQRGECKGQCPYCAAEALDGDEIIRCWCGAEGTYEELFDDAVFDRDCGGLGSLECECGGDMCVCHHHGEVECPGCPDCEPDNDEFDDGGFDDEFGGEG